MVRERSQPVLERLFRINDDFQLTIGQPSDDTWIFWRQRDFDPLAVQTTPDRVVHIMELRAAIDSVRVARGLGTFGWTDPTLTPGSTPVKALHVTELRTALNQAYQAAGRAVPTYTDPSVVAGAVVIKALHLSELRAAARAL